MLLKPMSERQRADRLKLSERVEGFQRAGTCPTCRHMETGDVYPFADDRAFYDDDRSVCMLELYPRNLGHTIVLVKPHYEDLSRVPRDIAQDVFGLVHSTVGALKYSTGAEKVYVNTMCDGRRNHLHFQLVPRLPGDEIRGSRLFVKERSMLTDYSEDIALLRTAMMEAERR